MMLAFRSLADGGRFASWLCAAAGTITSIDTPARNTLAPPLPCKPKLSRRHCTPHPVG